MKQLYTLRAVGRRAAALALSAVLAVTCVSLAPLGPASAQEESPDTASQSDAPEIKTVRVGWLLGNQGFQNGMPDEYMSGWGYEYLQTLSYYTPGWKYEYVPGTFPELIQKLKDGEIDLMPNISYTPERAEKLLFSSNPQGEEHYYIFAKPTNDALGAGDPAALNGMTIGVNPDVMQTEVGKQWIEAQGISCDYRYYSSGNALFDALSSGEVDAIIMNDTISSADAMPVFSVGESNYFFAVPKSRQDLMDDINTAISMLRSTNPRYNDEVKTRYSARNSGSSALNGLESAWLADHGNTITFGYLDNLLPFSNQGGGRADRRLAFRPGQHAGRTIRHHGERRAVRVKRGSYQCAARRHRGRGHAHQHGLLACRAGGVHPVVSSIHHLACGHLHGRQP